MNGMISQNNMPNKQANAKPKGNKRLVGFVVAVIATLWIAFGGVMLWGVMSSRHQAEVNGSHFVDGNKLVSGEEKDISEVVKKVSPSIVSIVTTRDNGRGMRSRLQKSAGTGMIISKNGYILTNKHVVKDAEGVEIILSDGTKFSRVKFIGEDPLNDIAFLKIEGVDNLQPVQFGDSGTVRVGQKVIAIGNSLGQYQNTVTSGIISGKGRPLQAASGDNSRDVEKLTDLLQTDAAINRGNSGGPLLNSSGQVIGINTAIVSDAQSVGFAIPINAAKGLTRSVLESGKVKKSYMGVRYIAITPDIKAEKKLSVNSGALVGAGSDQAIEAGGPADKAGIRQGDIILKVNDKSVGSDGGLGSLIAEFLPGQAVDLTVLRGDKQIKLKLTLGSYEA